MRQCTNCMRLLVLEKDFYKKHACCKECHYTRMKAWREANPDKVVAMLAKYKALRTPEEARATSLWTTYRLRPEDYDRMYQEQGGVCKICGQPETARNRRGMVRPLAVDHCHTSKQVRALLCNSCNTALGYYERDKSRFAEFENYLEGRTA